MDRQKPRLRNPFPQKAHGLQNGGGRHNDRTTPQTHTQPSITVQPTIRVFAWKLVVRTILGKRKRKYSTTEIIIA